MMASEHSSSGPALYEMTLGTLSSELVPQPPSSTPFFQPTRDDWDILLQPLFDEYFSPPPCVDHPVPDVASPVSAILTGSPSSTSFDQDAPSPKAVATACYTQNHSLIRIRHRKTPYELLHDRKPDLSYLHVIGALCYPANDSEDLGKLKAKIDVDFYELTMMASEHSSSGPALYEMTLRTLSSELVPQPPSSTPFFQPTRDDWDILLQTLFDEYFSPPPCVDHPVPDVASPVSTILTGSPSSTSVDQDAPSPSISQTLQESTSYVIPPGAKKSDYDIEVAHMDHNP
nr:hypothetical protein [Tanacetum cinerariifolium]